MKDYILLNYGNSFTSSFFYKKIGFNNCSKVIYVFDGQEDVLYVPFYELDYFKQNSIIKKIKAIPKSTNLINFISKLIIEKNQKIYIPAEFPSWLYSKLIGGMPNLMVRDYYFAYPCVIKEKSELHKMAKTGGVMIECFKMIRKILRKSKVKNGYLFYEDKRLSSALLIKKINIFLANYNVVCDFPIVGCGKYGYFMHNQGFHYLKAGEPIIIDLPSKNILDGYYVDVTRTFCKGYPKNKKFIEVYKIIWDIYNKIINLLKSGNQISRLAENYNTLINSFGIIIAEDSNDLIDNKSSFIIHHSLGHGIGKEMHQLPVVNVGTNVKFEQNMTVAIEPGVYLKKFGGIRIEDTFLIDNKQSINFTKGVYDFIIA